MEITLIYLVKVDDNILSKFYINKCILEKLIFFEK